MKIWEKRETRIILIDLTMMALLMLNLILIVFDWIFASITIQNLIREYLPVFFDVYHKEIHQNFVIVDLYFVAVFLFEFMVRWGIAVYERQYYKWFFYPFIHWYDLVGCIPVGSLRFLRVLRIVGIVIRLQNLQIIDITKTYLYAQFNIYTNILVEEVSDRVVVNVLDGIQSEIRGGSPVSDRILREVVLPKKESIVIWLSHRLKHISSNTHTLYQEDIRRYIHRRTQSAVKNNPEIAAIAQIPLVGDKIAGNLEKAIGDITFNTINGMIQDLASEKNRAVVEELADMTIDALLMEEEDERIDEMVNRAILEALELIKEQVKVQQWKLN